MDSWLDQTGRRHFWLWVFVMLLPNNQWTDGENNPGSCLRIPSQRSGEVLTVQLLSSVTHQTHHQSNFSIKTSLSSLIPPKAKQALLIRLRNTRGAGTGKTHRESDSAPFYNIGDSLKAKRGPNQHLNTHQPFYFLGGPCLLPRRGRGLMSRSQPPGGIHLFQFLRLAIFCIQRASTVQNVIQE